MLPSLFDFTQLGAMAAMHMAAIWQDASQRRIPNQIVVRGACAAMILALSPHGIGWISALGGSLIGLLFFGSLYLIRIMGAGDVKLVGATGLYIGSADMSWVCLKILIMGGLLALAWAIWTAQLQPVLNNLAAGLNLRWRAIRSSHPASHQRMPMSSTRIPYAIAIGAGTAAHLLSLHKLF